MRTPFPGSGAIPDSMAIDPEGRIVAAGFTTEALGAPLASPRVALARYLPNGELDSTFGSRGLVTTSVEGAADGADSVAVISDLLSEPRAACQQFMQLLS